jgi:hypothetical protein
MYGPAVCRYSPIGFQPAHATISAAEQSRLVEANDMGEVLADINAAI